MMPTDSKEVPSKEHSGVPGQEVAQSIWMEEEVMQVQVPFLSLSSQVEKELFTWRM
jgi:hypothetical protein